MKVMLTILDWSALGWQGADFDGWGSDQDGEPTARHLATAHTGSRIVPPGLVDLD
jgi:hypothetical protein